MKNIIDSYIIQDLSPGMEIGITMSNLGTRVASVQFEDSAGFHTLPEPGAVSSGDLFTIVLKVPPSVTDSRSSRIKIDLTAGAGEVVVLNWNLSKH